MKRIFVTGSTGILGPFLIAELLKDEQNEVHTLVRRTANNTPVDRLKTALETIGYGTISRHIGKRVFVYEGNVTLDKLGLPCETYLGLSNLIDEVFHCAANTDFAHPSNFMRLVNVTGTKKVLDFAKAIKGNGRSIKVNHVSTAYIAGYQQKALCFCEKDFDIGQKFNNTYEQSKYEAEILVNGYRDENIPVDIFRTSIIVGDSNTGVATNLKTIYQLIHVFLTEFYDSLPAIENASINVVPGNEAAKAIHIISDFPLKKPNQTYHITNNHELRFGYFVECASKFFNFRKPRLIPIEEFNFEDLSLVQRKLLQPFAPYMNNKITFDSSNASEILGKYRFRFSRVDEELLHTIFGYCLQRGFQARRLLKISE